jgi:hypothetical protein
MEWQPIETAPRDGTKCDVLVIWAADDGEPPEYIRCNNCWFANGEWVDGDPECDFDDDRRPAFWMPSPEMPKAPASVERFNEVGIFLQTLQNGWVDGWRRNNAILKGAAKGNA